MNNIVKFHRPETSLRLLTDSSKMTVLLVGNIQLAKAIANGISSNPTACIEVEQTPAGILLSCDNRFVYQSLLDFLL
jgi:hypothetical protein